MNIRVPGDFSRIFLERIKELDPMHPDALVHSIYAYRYA